MKVVQCRLLDGNPYPAEGRLDMSCRVCPWWLGYMLINPFRKLMQDPVKILSPYVIQGMTVLEPGPGMGFFTIEIARLVGPSGKVVAVDIQQKMLDALGRRLDKAGLRDRSVLRLVSDQDLNIDDLAGKADFALAFAMVHELPDQQAFFKDLFKALKPGGRVLFSEPSGHVNNKMFEASIEAAKSCGFAVESRPVIKRSKSVVLKK